MTLINANYETPYLEILEIETEGLLASSGGGDGTGETYGSQTGYDGEWS